VGIRYLPVLPLPPSQAAPPIHQPTHPPIHPSTHTHEPTPHPTLPPHDTHTHTHQHGLRTLPPGGVAGREQPALPRPPRAPPDQPPHLQHGAGTYIYMICIMGGGCACWHACGWCADGMFFWGSFDRSMQPPLPPFLRFILSQPHPIRPPNRPHEQQPQQRAPPSKRAFCRGPAGGPRRAGRRRRRRRRQQGWAWAGWWRRRWRVRAYVLGVSRVEWIRSSSKRSPDSHIIMNICPDITPSVFPISNPLSPPPNQKTGANGQKRKTRLPGALKQPTQRHPPPHARSLHKKRGCYAVLKMGSLALYRSREGEGGEGQEGPEAVLVFEPGTRVEVREGEEEVVMAVVGVGGGEVVVVVVVGGGGLLAAVFDWLLEWWADGLTE
jgi:hypothetical protein